MKRVPSGGWVAALGLLIALAPVAVSAERREPPTGAPPRSRTFRFDYGATINGLPNGCRVRVWLPVPPSNNAQQVTVLESLLPTNGQMGTEPVYGNKILYFETQGPASGGFAVTRSYLVHRREVRGGVDAGGQTKLSNEQRHLFLSASRNVPLAGKQLRLLDGVPFSRQPLAIARTLYDRVDAYLRYDKSKPGYGHGDLRWVCDSRCGNCTDFHSLFIAWARAKGVPARFEIGFALPPARGAGTVGGYHCWAFFHTSEQGWVPVDISEANRHPNMKEYYFGNLTEDRVTFTTGRDIELVPKQDGAPLNYFVYPYIEVNGTPWPREHVVLSLAYADVKGGRAP